MDAVIAVGAIDNDAMLLEGMAAWITGVDDIRLTETASSIDEFLSHARNTKVVLLDLNLEDFSNPADNVRRLVAAGHKVIVMSVIPDKSYVIATTQAGALAYVTKDKNLTLLADVIRSVATGKPAMTTEQAFLLSQDDRPTRPKLSPQEAKILNLYATGMTLESAARRAGVKYGTARTYLQRIQNKYAEVGRPITHRIDYASRVREDQFGRENIGPNPETETNDE